MGSREIKTIAQWDQHFETENNTGKLVVLLFLHSSTLARRQNKRHFINKVNQWTMRYTNVKFLRLDCSVMKDKAHDLGATAFPCFMFYRNGINLQSIPFQDTERILKKDMDEVELALESYSKSGAGTSGSKGGAGTSGSKGGAGTSGSKGGAGTSGSSA